ncbi:MAG: tRNA 2-thiocytidine biosynthesis protein TtcA [Clostridia bacterium]|nr:tRNA 2-thiocytidine biosynthesis protein TtcA [Clostridia bacterium]
METLEEYKQIERSIIKRFRKEIFGPFVRAIKKYDMIAPNDKIAVCISGGKDSMLLAKCMQEILRHGQMPFELVFLVMNPGYNKENHEKILNNAKKLNIPITIFETQIFDTVKEIKDSPCYLCARMRRGYLYSKAKELGCNKIALGHHFDDVIETILMSMLYGAEMKTMMPKVISQNFENMELIRPLYFVKEEHIIKWAKYNNLDFIRCACRFTENLENDDMTSKRLEMKKLISELRKVYENVDINIMQSAHNVNLDTLIGYKKDGVEYDFLDLYNKRKQERLIKREEEKK